VTNAPLTRQADAWLRDILGPILTHRGRFNPTAERALVRLTASVVTWDEGLGRNAGYRSPAVMADENCAWCQVNGERDSRSATVRSS
jgi:hypothetical protein